MSQSLFSLKFSDGFVGYNARVVCVAADLGNTRRNIQRGQILVIVPVENTGKDSGDTRGEKWELAHTAVTSVTETRNSDGSYTVEMTQNLVVYLPKRFNKTVENCRSLKEVVTAVNAVNDDFVLSGKWSWLDYSVTQDRGLETKHYAVNNPRRVQMTASDVARCKRLK